MDLELIKKIIKIVEKSEVSELSIQEGELKLKIVKNFYTPGNIPFQTKVEYSPETSQTILEKSDSQAIKTEVKEQATNVHTICSPIVGTFYRAPAPDAEPYIKIGDIISPGTVLCIVEAMKLMNEIESDVSGKVVKILVENESPVEYNQPLFEIELNK
ncbi:MAG: acetyl-CoA carboxylase biotin carboxyl carrier protein [Ignavibacteriales bacterium]|nr:acetyl-CoA carboxylase biotin carboxyl carrier protein [Ignavibacteriales bacterium]